MPDNASDCVTSQPQCGGCYDFSQKGVMDRLDNAKNHMKNRVKDTPAPKSGYLDTQLFPHRDLKPED